MEFMDKKNILDLAKRHGLNVLEPVVVDRGVIPAGIKYPIITKDINPNSGAWKSDVFICKNEQELKEAYEKISSPVVLLQHYIEKKTEITFEGCSVNKGKSALLAIQCEYKYCIPGYYSPFMDVYTPKDKKLVKALEDMLAEIGFEGIYEIEFLVDQDNSLYFSEINFRNATWSYASTVAGMPLPLIYLEGMISKTILPEFRKEVPAGFLAMVEPVDCEKRKELRISSYGEWLADFRKCNCPYYYGKGDDLNPFFEMVNNWDKLK